MRNKSLLILILLFSVLASDAQEIFKSEKYRFSILEPDGWQKKLNREQYFNLDKNNGKNLVTYTKYKRGENKEINPTINISVENRGTKPENFVNKMLKPSSWNETYYLEHSFAKNPEIININGKNVVYGIVNFKYNSHGTPKTTFRKRIYYILESKKLYKIVFIDDQTIEADTKLFDEIASSIKINQIN